jgi:DNA repair protein RadA/Sms
MKLDLAKDDLFFNVAGGLRLSEPACDLAAAAAVWSSAEDRPLPADWVFVGELGLTGEVRRVSQPEARLDEARKLGFKTLVVPRSSLEYFSSRLGAQPGLKLVPISTVGDLPKVLS